MAKMKPETVLKRMINKLEFKPVNEKSKAIYSHDSEGNLVFVLERDGVWIVRQAFFDGKETRYVNTEYKSNPLNAK